MATEPDPPALWSVRVGATGKGTAGVFARRHQFTVGAPVTFDDAHEHVSALEYVLGAVGAELVNGMVALAQRRRLAIDGAEAVVQGELDDPLAYLGVVGATGHAGLARVTVRAYVSSLEEEDALRGLWEEVLERSPVARTLRSAIRFETTLKISL
jgi:uncharacterized OsmC-like protein